MSGRRDGGIETPKKKDPYPGLTPEGEKARRTQTEKSVAEDQPLSKKEVERKADPETN